MLLRNWSNLILLRTLNSTIGVTNEANRLDGRCLNKIFNQFPSLWLSLSRLLTHSSHFFTRSQNVWSIIVRNFCFSDEKKNPRGKWNVMWCLSQVRSLLCQLSFGSLSLIYKRTKSFTSKLINYFNDDLYLRIYIW